MALGEPERLPVMCQASIGHTLLQTGVDPAAFFLTSATYADALLALRAQYDFDGILLHKPGRESDFGGRIAERVAADGGTVLHMEGGARIECRADDDPYLRTPDGFRLPEVTALDPVDPLAWAPAWFRAWCHHKGTATLHDAADIPAHWFDAIDHVRAAASPTYGVHGEVRSPLDHLLNIVGLQEGLMALLTEPEHCRALLESFTRSTIVWAVAQAQRGCDAIKISSPYTGAGFLSRDMYAAWVVPSERPVAEAVRAVGARVYTHTCGAIGDRLDLMAETGIDGIETLDPPPLGTIDLAEAKRTLRDRLFIKGNVDPVHTLLRKPREAAREDVRRVAALGREGGQFILSTACSIAPATPAENVRLLAEVAGEGA